MERMRYLFIALLLSSCGRSGPLLDIGISDPDKHGMQMTYEDGHQGFEAYENTVNWVCMPPDDFQRLLEYAKKNCR